MSQLVHRGVLNRQPPLRATLAIAESADRRRKIFYIQRRGGGSAHRYLYGARYSDHGYLCTMMWNDPEHRVKCSNINFVSFCDRNEALFMKQHSSDASSRPIRLIGWGLGRAGAGFGSSGSRSASLYQIVRTAQLSAEHLYQIEQRNPGHAWARFSKGITWRNDKEIEPCEQVTDPLTCPASLLL